MAILNYPGFSPTYAGLGVTYRNGQAPTAPTVGPLPWASTQVAPVGEVTRGPVTTPTSGPLPWASIQSALSAAPTSTAGTTPRFIPWTGPMPQGGAPTSGWHIATFRALQRANAWERPAGPWTDGGPSRPGDSQCRWTRTWGAQYWAHGTQSRQPVRGPRTQSWRLPAGAGGAARSVWFGPGHPE